MSLCVILGKLHTHNLQKHGDSWAVFGQKPEGCRQQSQALTLSLCIAAAYSGEMAFLWLLTAQLVPAPALSPFPEIRALRSQCLSNVF